ncbi:hypothetical protein JCM9533A_00020 [Catenuloplanes niger JCM 9533]
MSATASATPPTFVQTVGRPHAIASTTVYGKPSEMLVRATMLPAWYASTALPTRPSRVAQSLSPSSSISSWQDAW